MAHHTLIKKVLNRSYTTNPIIKINKNRLYSHFEYITVNISTFEAFCPYTIDRFIGILCFPMKTF